ncbi:MAG: sucrose phosphorylase [Paludibacter sp.]|nr:sucrose phosphorylase [Paludibacter sp.]
MAVKNKVQLITYPDSLGGDLKALKKILDNQLNGLFQGGIHILPPFPSSGDRGFAPLTYLEIEPSFGDWKDIQAISREYDVLLDLMVNHISRKSEFFQDFLKEGFDSKYADLFISLDKYWHNGVPVQDDVDKMFLRRDVPYSTFEIGKNKELVKVWTTFGKQDPSEQIDLDIRSAITRQLLTDFMVNFSKNNIKIVRLDAVGYVIKKLGTSCFFVEPDIYKFLDWITKLAHSLDIELLPEVHSHYSVQFKLAEKGHWIYDFILPYYVLETLINKSSKRLTEYLKIRPHKQFTMLDCHDGVPVKPDLDELVSTADARKLVDVCLERGSNLSLIFSDKHKSEDGFDVHQIRGTIYSMLDKDDDAYIAARAIQFFVPGIPQVYYAGMLAGENDVENVQKTGEGREINRHNYSVDEIQTAVDKPVVQRLMKLIKFRNELPAFDGVFSVEDADDSCIRLNWKLQNSFCELNIDLKSMKSIIKYIDTQGAYQEFMV